MRGAVIAETVEWPLLLTVGLLLALALLLGFLLARRDPDIRRARYGLFVERERFEDEEDDQVTRSWPRQGREE